MKLIERPLYLNKLLENIGRNEIKILTGARRVGKSSILDLFCKKLVDDGIAEKNIIRIDCDSIDYCFFSSGMTLYEFLIEQISDAEKTFLIVDEVQNVVDWQQAIVKLKSNFDVDIYISSSGRSIIDEEICSQLNHRPIEIEVFPLSFKEYQKFTSLSESRSLIDIFSDYLRFGSMPVLSAIQAKEILRDIFFSITSQDVFNVNKVADNELMNLLIKILFTEVGNIHSFNSLSKIISEVTNKLPAVKTIENYIKMLIEAKLFYAVPVFDIKNNISLVRYTKYYPVDLGFYSFIMGAHELYDDRILESVVYFELIRLGARISTCKLGNKKVAFLAETEDNKIYIQVTNTLIGREKEFLNPLRAINDHYSKWILTLDNGYAHSYDGIRISNIIDFLNDE